MFIADAPAKAYALQIKNHNGYFSCTKCKIEEENIYNRMCFPCTDAPSRTNEQFHHRTDEDYHMELQY